MSRILFAAFEGMPFLKTGGLADVVEGLPHALKQEGETVVTVLPFVNPLMPDTHYEKLKEFQVSFGIKKAKAVLYHCLNDERDIYFIGNDHYFNRPSIYGYEDDGERFVFFSAAILTWLQQEKELPDIIHEHDYHMAPLLALMKLKEGVNEHLRRIPHVFTIHNLAFQGNYDKTIVHDWLGLSEEYYRNGLLRYNDQINFMKMAVVLADRITTVSPTYACEIMTPMGGQGLDTVLHYRKEVLSGILNGVNPRAFEVPYTTNTRVAGKHKAKLAYQKECGLPMNKDVFMIGMVSRLTYQKGIFLILEVLKKMLKKDIQVVILGSGETQYEYALKDYMKEYPLQVHYDNCFDEARSHRLYAACDMIMVPSLFEPCGLTQMIAMHYGALPLVRETGGLKDTVIPYNYTNGQGNGFSFGPCNSEDFYHVFLYAYEQYIHHPKVWRALTKNAMTTDVSFDRATQAYRDLYEEVKYGSL